MYSLLYFAKVSREFILIKFQKYLQSSSTDGDAYHQNYKAMFSKYPLLAAETWPSLRIKIAVVLLNCA